ncbi:predicted protein [Thalassiosira pseudonana CCMP1335]|uniref:Uncharacterized protein n=1 Tax=Thalassiosira pseudonana TaxID=35128 RepID=B8LDP3_THAPS|nr:predicted protein [Thalassiosira pseudonana CCMP1335]EED86519.1 predicted protein [Thalassiosira pseudonana CCMP1335]
MSAYARRSLVSFSQSKRRTSTNNDSHQHHRDGNSTSNAPANHRDITTTTANNNNSNNSNRDGGGIQRFRNGPPQTLLSQRSRHHNDHQQQQQSSQHDNDNDLPIHGSIIAHEEEEELAFSQITMSQGMDTTNGGECGLFLSLMSTSGGTGGVTTAPRNVSNEGCNSNRMTSGKIMSGGVGGKYSRSVAWNTNGRAMGGTIMSSTAASSGGGGMRQHQPAPKQRQHQQVQEQSSSRFGGAQRGDTNRQGSSSQIGGRGGERQKQQQQTSNNDNMSQRSSRPSSHRREDAQVALCASGKGMMHTSATAANTTSASSSSVHNSINNNFNNNHDDDNFTVLSSQPLLTPLPISHTKQQQFNLSQSSKSSKHGRGDNDSFTPRRDKRARMSNCSDNGGGGGGGQQDNRQQYSTNCQVVPSRKQPPHSSTITTSITYPSLSSSRRNTFTKTAVSTLGSLSSQLRTPIIILRAASTSTTAVATGTIGMGTGSTTASSLARTGVVASVVRSVTNVMTPRRFRSGAALGRGFVGSISGKRTAGTALTTVNLPHSLLGNGLGAQMEVEAQPSPLSRPSSSRIWGIGSALKSSSRVAVAATTTTTPAVADKSTMQAEENEDGGSIVECSMRPHNAIMMSTKPHVESQVSGEEEGSLSHFSTESSNQSSLKLSQHLSQSLKRGDIHQDEEDDNKSKMSASTYDPTMLSSFLKRGDFSFQQAEDLLSSIQSAQKEMETVRKEIGEQRKLLQQKGEEIANQNADLDKKQCTILEKLEELDRKRECTLSDTQKEHKQARKCKSVMEGITSKFESDSEELLLQICQLVNSSKDDIQSEKRQALELIETHAQELRTQAVKLANDSIDDVESARDCAIETVESHSCSARLAVNGLIDSFKGIVANAKSDFQSWVGGTNGGFQSNADGVVDATSIKESGCFHRSPELSTVGGRNSKHMHIMRLAVATSRWDEKDASSMSEQSGVGVDESVLHRDNVAATATLFSRRALSLQNNYGNNRSSSVQSSEPHHVIDLKAGLRRDMSISTTPFSQFSKKSTPLIRNSYGRINSRPSVKSSTAVGRTGKVAVSVLTKSSGTVSSRANKDSMHSLLIESKCKSSGDPPKFVSLTEREEKSPARPIKDKTKENISASLRSRSEKVEMATTKSVSEPKPRGQSKRDRSGFNAVKSPRRSKRLKEITRVERQSALNVLPLKTFTDKQTHPKQVTSKENEATPLAASSYHSSIVDTRRSSITEASQALSDGYDSLLGTSVVVDEGTKDVVEDVGLDGSENDHQHSGRPLRVPWGNKAVKNRRNKSYYNGRKCDRKTFSETLSSIFDFNF